MKTLEQLAREVGGFFGWRTGISSWIFSHKELARFRAACRAEALEEAAQACENEEVGFRNEGDGCRDGRYDWMADGAKSCAAAIREMK